MIFSALESMFILSTSRTGTSLLEHALPQSVLFQPSKTYMKPAHRFSGPPPQALTSGGATPMPDRTYSSTPAWDPSSRTPQYPYFYFG